MKIDLQVYKAKILYSNNNEKQRVRVSNPLFLPQTQKAKCFKWQMRLKLPDRAGYSVKSTKVAREEKAADGARHEYSQIVYKIGNNLEIENMTL